MRDGYQDTIKAQLLDTANHLRLKANLLPEDSKIFFCGISDFHENLPHVFAKKCYRAHPKYNIGQILQEKFETLFYIPSSTEIMELENSVSEDAKQQAQIQTHFIE